MISENFNMECLSGNHFELSVDNLEPSRLMSCSVREVLDTTGAYLTVNFYLCRETLSYFEGSKDFAIGTLHTVKYRLYLADGRVLSSVSMECHLHEKALVADGENLMMVCMKFSILSKTHLSDKYFTHVEPSDNDVQK